MNCFTTPFSTSGVAREGTHSSSIGRDAERPAVNGSSTTENGIRHLLADLSSEGRNALHRPDAVEGQLPRVALPCTHSGCN